MNTLGVRIDNNSKSAVLNKISEFFDNGKPDFTKATPGKQHKIFTPNPEMLVDAQKDEYFKQVLNSGDLNVCDGFGLSLVSGVPRYPGVELMLDICALAEKEGRSVYLLGSGDKTVISNLQLIIKEKFPNLKIVGSHPGHKLQVTSYKLQVDKEQNDELIANIILSAPDILFVAFGHNKQEKWIEKNLKNLPSVKIAMGVGGSFDFISGKVKRAPLLIRKIGLEWMWRVVLEPKRLRRILNATVKFTYLVIKSVFSNQ